MAAQSLLKQTESLGSNTERLDRNHPTKNVYRLKLKTIRDNKFSTNGIDTQRKKSQIQEHFFPKKIERDLIVN